MQGFGMRLGFISLCLPARTGLCTPIRSPFQGAALLIICYNNAGIVHMLVHPFLWHLLFYMVL